MPDTVCVAGWQGDGHSCEDVDECATGAAQCDQKCVNLPGGFRCECNDGYKLVSFGPPQGLPGSSSAYDLSLLFTHCLSVQLGSATLAICVPVDQCADNNGGCEQTCKSNGGVKTCSCG